MVTIRNETPEEIVITDHYLTDMKLNIGYDGVIEHRIAVNGKKSISSAEYVDQLMEEKKPQQIHMRSGEETKLVLHHNNLSDNKEIVFKMQGGSITVSYSPKTATTFAERIWSMFPFCGSGFNGESPVTVTPRVTGVGNSAARIDSAAGIVGAEG